MFFINYKSLYKNYKNDYCKKKNRGTDKKELEDLIIGSAQKHQNMLNIVPIVNTIKNFTNDNPKLQINNDNDIPFNIKFLHNYLVKVYELLEETSNLEGNVKIDKERFSKLEKDVEQYFNLENGENIVEINEAEFNTYYHFLERNSFFILAIIYRIIVSIYKYDYEIDDNHMEAIDFCFKKYIEQNDNEKMKESNEEKKSINIEKNISTENDETKMNTKQNRNYQKIKQKKKKTISLFNEQSLINEQYIDELKFKIIDNDILNELLKFENAQFIGIDNITYIVNNLKLFIFFTMQININETEIENNKKGIKIVDFKFCIFKQSIFLIYVSEPYIKEYQYKKVKNNYIKDGYKIIDDKNKIILNNYLFTLDNNNNNSIISQENLYESFCEEIHNKNIPYIILFEYLESINAIIKKDESDIYVIQNIINELQNIIKINNYLQLFEKDLNRNKNLLNKLLIFVSSLLEKDIFKYLKKEKDYYTNFINLIHLILTFFNSEKLIEEYKNEMICFINDLVDRLIINEMNIDKKNKIFLKLFNYIYILFKNNLNEDENKIIRNIIKYYFEYIKHDICLTDDNKKKLEDILTEEDMNELLMDNKKKNSTCTILGGNTDEKHKEYKDILSMSLYYEFCNLDIEDPQNIFEFLYIDIVCHFQNKIIKSIKEKIKMNGTSEEKYIFKIYNKKYYSILPYNNEIQ